MRQTLIFPDTLKKSDVIAIISPASVVKAEYIDAAAEYIRSQGYEPLVMPHAKGPADGSYAASSEDRLADLLAAWQMPEVKAIVCSRGGYGAAHLLPLIPGRLLRENPKWLIGFSDISALHALSFSQGVASIHGPMTKHWNSERPEAADVMHILESGEMPRYEFENNDRTKCPENIPGRGQGVLVGGNLAVLNGLAATPFDLLAVPMKEDCILFIEDIAEPIYKIERILYRLFMQGVLERLKGLIVGAFTESKADKNFDTTELMIGKFLRDHNLSHFPVAFGAPFGHIDHNMPLIEGAEVEIEVSSGAAILSPFSPIA